MSKRIPFSRVISLALCSIFSSQFIEAQTIEKTIVNKPPNVLECATKTRIMTVPRISRNRQVNNSSDTTVFSLIMGPELPPKVEKTFGFEFNIFKDTANLIYEESTEFPPTNTPLPFKEQIGFKSNMGDDSRPLDNSVAVSNRGKVISVSNGRIDIYHNSTLKFTRSLSQFIDFEIPRPCDPKVLFDPEIGKFIFFAQRCDRNFNKSQIIIGFSESADPLGFWNFYVLTGNPTGKRNEWFDYPKMGLSSDGLYISGNIFKGSSSFSETVIYQINKHDGYNGQNLRFKVWMNICDEPFTIQPVSYGFDGSYGKGIYMIGTTWMRDSRTVKLYHITGDLLDNESSLSLYLVDVPAYDFFAKAVQNGNRPIDNGDLRIQDAVYDGERIHYVFTSGNRRRFSRINYNILDVRTLTNRNIMIGDLANTSYAYPSINMFSDEGEEIVSLIQYNASSNNSFPTILCKSCDINLNCTKESVIRNGNSNIDGERWGDYSTIAKVYGETNSAWLASSYGDLGKRATYLSKIVPIERPSLNSDSLLIEQLVSSRIQSLDFEIKKSSEVEVQLISETGQTTPLYNGLVESGSNKLNVATSSLEEGEYTLKVMRKNNNKILKEIEFKINDYKN